MPHFHTRRLIGFQDHVQCPVDHVQKSYRIASRSSSARQKQQATSNTRAHRPAPGGSMSNKNLRTTANTTPNNAKPQPGNKAAVALAQRLKAPTSPRRMGAASQPLGRPDWASLHVALIHRPKPLPLVVCARKAERLSIPVELGGTSYAPLAREELEWHAMMAARMASRSFKPVPQQQPTTPGQAKPFRTRTRVSARRSSDPGLPTLQHHQRHPQAAPRPASASAAAAATPHLTDWLAVQQEVQHSVRGPTKQRKREPLPQLLRPHEGWAGDDSNTSSTIAHGSGGSPTRLQHTLAVQPSPPPGAKNRAPTRPFPRGTRRPATAHQKDPRWRPAGRQ
eukprot:COSAG05_NODE_1438_length_4885_cov_3.395529_6_plen_337_part_00